MTGQLGVDACIDRLDGGLESSTLPTGLILAERLRIRGFVVLDHEGDYPAFRAACAERNRLRRQMHGVRVAAVARADRPGQSPIK
ncbi:hypothetical protein [Novosphingobium sp. Fuku2-ISO-50]|uniref:hypothetical protein n=1 Tax=Novosphingobium sp. Fuku2-ISO-50 TaxID=1739114 RepID=UPI00076BD3F3|nr:hypothetical protein AQZ50_00530 [Novosphingobium sp. Fuku2-ISO-50]